MSRHSYPPVPVPRTAVVKLSLTPDEKAELVTLSRRSGRSVTEIVRTHLPLSTNPLRDVQPVEVVRSRGDA